MGQLKLKNISKRQLIELAEIKASSFNRNNSYQITIDDLFDYLSEVKWRNRNTVSMHEIVEDLFGIDEREIYEFLSTQAIIRSKELKLEDFTDLIES